MINYLPEPTNKDFLDLILRFARLAEYREGDNTHHLSRIQRYCRILASSYGLSPKETEIIAIASHLHDLGKIRIPKGMVHKADNLNPDEWEIIKSHTTIGANLLKGSSSAIIQAAEIIALTHHERWDGSGYPQGLKEDEIPVSGRICAIADVFDALTTRRSYKDEITPEEASKLVQDYSGELFDPSMVKIFVEKFDEIKKIRKKIR